MNRNNSRYFPGLSANDEAIAADVRRTAFSVIVSRTRGKVGTENCAKTSERTLLKKAKRMGGRMGSAWRVLAVVERRDGFSDGTKPRKSPIIGDWESDTRSSARLGGGRDRDRTCDPYHVKVVLSR